MTYSIAKVKEAISGVIQTLSPVQFLKFGNKRFINIEHVLIDSRKLVFPETTLFFALKGKRHNGHLFIKELYEKGVRSFVITEEVDVKKYPDAFFFQVPDVLRGLQDLAAFHRKQYPDLKVIGITGSNGKTIIKEWLYQLLKDDFNIVRSPKSYNSQLGVPLSILLIRPEHTLAIIEAGISNKNEMEHLERVIQPNWGVFTVLGDAHAEGFEGSNQKKMIEKALLFNHATKLFFNADNAIVVNAMSRFSLKKHRIWSTRLDTAQLKIVKTEKIDGKYTKITASNRESTQEIEIPFTDKASIDNACLCWLILQQMNYTPDVIAKRMKTLEPVEMRLELKAGINGCLVVNDAYNADLTSLQIGLDFINQQSRQLGKTVILSDFLQSGQSAEVLFQKIGDLMLEKGVSKIIGIGDNVKVLNNGKFPNATFFKTTDAFLEALNNADFNNEIILLKGARTYEFERIAERLAMKAHKTVLEINLNALVHNLQVFSKALKPNVKMMAMVKASAYGQGSDEVARLLEFHNVDYLAVAYADEGIDLRNKGVKMPIMVMNPEEASFDAMKRFDLEPEIYSLKLLNQYVDFTKGFAETTFKIHLKLDTGMHRLGFEKADIQQVIGILKQNKNIEIVSIFTHLAASEAKQHDDFTKQQVELFTAIFSEITEGVGYKPMRHILNSSGILRHPQYQFEMVRLGIGLYGIDGSGDFQDKLQIVQTLKAAISQIKNVPHDETVGYSRKGTLERDSRIATLSIGYADGLLRGAGNGRFSVLLHGKRAPTVGNICMDMTMVDVTDIPEANEGDEVEIFGTNIPNQELAAALDTIPYEIFTNISERVKRVYFQE
jgi:Alr-MurF fusion protein